MFSIKQALLEARRLLTGQRKITLLAAKNLGRKIFGYFSQFVKNWLLCFLATWRKIKLSSQLVLPIGVLLALVFFGFAFSSRLAGGFSNLASYDNNLIIEKGLPAPPLPELREELDFKAAAFRESVPDIPLALGGTSLIPPGIEFLETVPLTRSEIQIYVVAPGDTVSTIAQKFGLKWSTILWANNLNSWSIIRPGNELKILPIDGIIYEVKKGENLSSIAKKYKVPLEEIIKFNNLSEDSILEIGQILIIPHAIPPPPPKPKYEPKPQAEPQFVQENYSNYRQWLSSSSCYKFHSGQCTSWVAFKWATEQGQCVPSWSHAKYWWGRAKKDGYETGYTPQKGAIIVLWCTSWLCARYGHVGYVEDFDANTVTFSEMNGPEGPWIKDVRTLNKTLDRQDAWRIIGYIYPK